MKQSIGRFFLQLFSVALFLVVAGMAVFFAYGYRIDLGGSVEKTSIIDIPIPDVHAEVYLDGSKYGESLPIQLKGVLPGEHNVIVRKKGFISWSRPVEVKEDVVSIVQDVLLIPSDLNPYIHESVVFEEDQSFIFGKNYLLAFVSGANNVQTIVFADNGLIVNEDIFLYRGDFEVLHAFSDERLFLGFENDSYAILGLDNQAFEFFSLPPTTESVTVEPSGRNIYFLESGSLYALSVDEALEDRQFTFNSQQYQLLHEDVERFVVSSNGDLFFSSLGMLYQMSHNDGILSLIEREPGSIEAVRLIPGKNYDLLILTHHDSTMLFAVDREGKLLEINKNIEGEAFINDENFVLYTDSDRILRSYNFRKELDREIRTLEENETIIGWFDGINSYYLLKQDRLIFITDIYNANTTLLLEDVNPSAVFTKDSALFWLQENRLMKLFWE